MRRLAVVAMLALSLAGCGPRRGCRRAPEPGWGPGVGSAPVHVPEDGSDKWAEAVLVAGLVWAALKRKRGC